MPTAQLVLSIRKRKTFVSLVMGQLGTLSLSWEKPPARKKIDKLNLSLEGLDATSAASFPGSASPPHYYG
jgi:hypothetical protein